MTNYLSTAPYKMWDINPNFCQSHGRNGGHELKNIEGKGYNFIIEKMEGNYYSLPKRILKIIGSTNAVTTIAMNIYPVFKKFLSSCVSSNVKPLFCVMVLT